MTAREASHARLFDDMTTFNTSDQITADLTAQYH